MALVDEFKHKNLACVLLQGRLAIYKKWNNGVKNFEKWLSESRKDLESQPNFEDFEHRMRKAVSAIPEGFNIYLGEIAENQPVGFETLFGESERGLYTIVVISSEATYYPLTDQAKKIIWGNPMLKSSVKEFTMSVLEYRLKCIENYLAVSVKPEFVMGISPELGRMAASGKLKATFIQETPNPTIELAKEDMQASLSLIPKRSNLHKMQTMLKLERRNFLSAIESGMIDGGDGGFDKDQEQKLKPWRPRTATTSSPQKSRNSGNEWSFSPSAGKNLSPGRVIPKQRMELDDLQQISKAGYEEQKEQTKASLQTMKGARFKNVIHPKSAQPALFLYGCPKPIDLTKIQSKAPLGKRPSSAQVITKYMSLQDATHKHGMYEVLDGNVLLDQRALIRNYIRLVDSAVKIKKREMMLSKSEPQKLRLKVSDSEADLRSPEDPSYVKGRPTSSVTHLKERVQIREMEPSINKVNGVTPMSRFNLESESEDHTQDPSRVQLWGKVSSQSQHRRSSVAVPHSKTKLTKPTVNPRGLPKSVYISKCVQGSRRLSQTNDSSLSFGRRNRLDSVSAQYLTTSKVGHGALTDTNMQHANQMSRIRFSVESQSVPLGSNGNKTPQHPDHSATASTLLVVKQGLAVNDSQQKYTAIKKLKKLTTKTHLQRDRISKPAAVGRCDAPDGWTFDEMKDQSIQSPCDIIKGKG